MSRSLQDNLPPDVGVVIPAGGRGERAGGGLPKQFREIAGIPMLLRCIRPFARQPDVFEVVIPLPASDFENPPQWLAEISGERVRLVAGGETRAESVQNGVTALAAECTTVLIHDAARPFVSPEVVQTIAERARKGEAVLAGVRATDTLKKVDHNLQVIETVDRSTVWRAQTPQGFPRDMLMRAYDSGTASSGTDAPTDEANLVERMGERVSVVQDNEWNLKITTPADFELAELLASRR
jgi:2-C-methyl-D-erythritol 4-phosphate cytidylyltransferase